MTMDIVSALAVLMPGATPFFEARYAIPAAIVMGYPPSSAFALGIPFNRAFPAIISGAIVAALILTLPTLGIMSRFGRG
jgi:uncharacterized membrane protein